MSCILTVDLRTEARFWGHVHVSPGCWEWTGHLNRDGYGLLWRGDQLSEMLAHRVAYAIANGPLDDSVVVRHRCDNPKCVRPDHLAAGTRADNHADMVERGRQSRGKAHSDAVRNAPRLTADMVSMIRSEAGRKYSAPALAALFRVSAKAVLDVRRGRTW